MQSVQEHLEREEMTREEIAKQLKVVRTDYENEMMALEHSKKLGL